MFVALGRQFLRSREAIFAELGDQCNRVGRRFLQSREANFFQIRETNFAEYRRRLLQSGRQFLQSRETSVTKKASGENYILITELLLKI